MNYYGSAVESIDDRNLCSECYRETSNEGLCADCLKDKDEEEIVGEEIGDDN